MSEVIAAISTPLVSAGIGVIRISGNGAFEVADRVFKAAGGKKIAEISGYRTLYGRVFDQKGEIDEVVALKFKAPNSFTGEDVVEFSCHGSVYILKRVLATILQNGARLAAAGEFTRRAFENGKMDLSAAESVMELIGAESSLEHAAALAGRDGVLYRRIGKIRDNLVTLAGHLAAWVDFPDEDVPEVDENELRDGLTAAENELNRLIEDAEGGMILRKGIATAIVGKPNVGKSTFMNLLCGSERSIVTDVAGTTRDIVEETVVVGGIKLRLSDTAGLHETDDRVEQIGVNLARGRIDTAALILAVFDGSKPLDKDDMDLIGSLSGKKAVGVINKSDLVTNIDTEYIYAHIPNTVTVSAKSGDGAECIGEAVAKAVGVDGIDPKAGILTTERQKACVLQAKGAVSEAIGVLNIGLTFDAVGVLLDEAIGALCALSGEKVSETIVDEVFSSFCVGK